MSLSIYPSIYLLTYLSAIWVLATCTRLDTHIVLGSMRWRFVLNPETFLEIQKSQARICLFWNDWRSRFLQIFVGQLCQLCQLSDSCVFCWFFQNKRVADSLDWVRIVADHLHPFSRAGRAPKYLVARMASLRVRALQFTTRRQVTVWVFPQSWKCQMLRTWVVLGWAGWLIQEKTRLNHKICILAGWWFHLFKKRTNIWEEDPHFCLRGWKHKPEK